MKRANSTISPYSYVSIYLIPCTAINKEKAPRSDAPGGFGPSGATRTPGLLNPNQARYHLRYTRIFSFCYYTTQRTKIKDFPVCGHSCGQGRLSARFADPVKSRKRPCRKGFRAFVSLVVDEVHGTPKAGALPTALIPVIYLTRYSAENSSESCRFVRPPSCPPIPDHLSWSPIGTLPRNSLAASTPGGASAISPKQARYQLRYTRLFAAAPYYKGRQRFFQAFPSLRQTFSPARVMAAVNQNTHCTRG